jgi:hypothetical protein
MKTVSQKELLKRGYSLKDMPQRGFALRTIDNTLVVFRLADASVFAKIVKAIIKAFSLDKHIDIVICNVQPA